MTPKRSTPAGPRVAVIGAGSWGTTFGKILADGGAQVTTVSYTHLTLPTKA